MDENLGNPKHSNGKAAISEASGNSIRDSFQARPKAPSNLLAALRMKKAALVRPSPRGEGSHLFLKSGEAFVKTIIYFVPLVVSLAADNGTETDKEINKAEGAPWITFGHAFIRGEQRGTI